jgi:serine protease AprX
VLRSTLEPSRSSKLSGAAVHSAKRTAASTFVLATFLAFIASPPAIASEPPGPVVSVIVRTLPGGPWDLEDSVRALGGTISRRLGIINGFAASIRTGAIHSLEQSPGVLSVTTNAGIHLMGLVDGVDPNKFPGSWTKVAHNAHLLDMWQRGYIGTGIDVALIDSGVAPVSGLDRQVINGPDLSFESQAPNLTNIDTYGHGTHLAGLIAGRDPGLKSGREDEDVDKFFEGAAPGARVVSLKVAASDGATDVSQVIAAIDWVVQHQHSDGLNIRVLNLSFGTDGTQDYVLDPLAYAVEVAWLKGIVVVVAAGNNGLDTPTLTDPAVDPYVIAVGADDTRGTDDPKDDLTPSWQSRGNDVRHPDLVAPGKSIVSLRNPSSFVDEGNNGARLGLTPRFFKGSGSSQAAAIVSGAVALVLQQHPDLTPDQVKALLKETASALPKADSLATGSGLINLHAARDAKSTVWANAAQTWPKANGSGSLQLARGSVQIEEEGVVLTGEQDIFGGTWDGQAWAANSWNGTTWVGGSWDGRTWSGEDWSGQSWSGRTWSGRTWSDSSWTGRTWSGRTWSGRTWSSNGWSTGQWSTGDAPSALSGAAWSGTIWGD